MTDQGIKDATLVEEGKNFKIWTPQHKENVLWFEHVDSYPTQARAAIDAFIFTKISSSISWERLPLSPALIHIREDWLERRWNHLIYSHVACKHGLPTIFKRLVDEKGQTVSLGDLKQANFPVLIETCHTKIENPQLLKLESEEFFSYPHQQKAKTNRCIPLAALVHFGKPASNPATPFATETVTGPISRPEPGNLLSIPALELVTTRERIQRSVGIQEALLVSGLPPGQLDEMLEMAYDISLLVYALWAQATVELWSLRLEFVQSREGISVAGSFNACVMRYKEVFLPQTEKSGAGSRIHDKPEFKNTDCQKFQELKWSIELQLANLLIGHGTFECANPLGKSIQELSELSA